VRIICVANSYKHGGRCIAGIDPETGKLIRPVSCTQKRAIGKETRIIDGEEPRVLEELEIPLEEYGPDEGCQPENRLLKEGRWKKVGRVDPEALLRHCENDSVILHNNLDYVRGVALKVIPKYKWKSLQLVRNRDVNFDADSRDSNRWRASFTNSKGTPMTLSVTDPVACERLAKGEDISKDCILTISMAAPWRPNKSQGRRCYKFVSGVIELGASKGTT
jgi:hypothetical protein